MTARKLVFGFFAAMVVITPLLMATWFSLCPQYWEPACPGTAAPENYFPAVRAAPPTLLQAFLAVNLAVPYVFPLGFIGMAMVTWPRSPWLTIAGVALGWISSIAWGPIADELLTWTLVARANHDAVFSALLRGVVGDWHVSAIGAGWVIGHLLAYLLLGIAMWRSRTVPVWSAVLIIVSVPVQGPLAYGLRLGALQVLGYVAIAVACIPAALTLVARAGSRR